LRASRSLRAATRAQYDTPSTSPVLSFATTGQEMPLGLRPFHTGESGVHAVAAVSTRHVPGFWVQLQPFNAVL
jgi:hypothetical protein